VNRVAGGIADAIDSILHDGFAPWLRRVIVVGGALLLVASGVLVATSLFGSDRTARSQDADRTADQPSQSAAPGTSTPPAEDVAGSRRLVADFDTLPTDSEIEGWTLSGGARLTTAAQPTAVDRSARLDGDGIRTACHTLDVDLAALAVTFMLDRVGDGEVAALSLALGDGTTHRLTVAEGEAMAAPATKPVVLDAGRWYRWEVALGDEDVRMGVLAADGTRLTEVSTDAVADRRATEFCMTAAPSARLFLSDLTVEIR
jgi:hypothetical protein